VPTLSQFPKNLAFTAFQIGSPAAGGNSAVNWGLVLWHNVTTPAGVSMAPTPSATIVDAVVSSSAMPGMLAPYGLNSAGNGGYIDGAFLAHEPTLPAIALAVASGVPLEQIVVLSIGAGLMPTYMSADTSQWGAQQWMGNDPTANYSGIEPFLLGGNPSPMLSMALNGTTAMLTPQLAQLMLGDRFFCLSPKLSPPLSEADSSTAAQNELLAAANGDPNIPAAIEFVTKYWSNACQPAPIATT
jgi:hypothetical protein